MGALLADVLSIARGVFAILLNFECGGQPGVQRLAGFGYQVSPFHSYLRFRSRVELNAT
jgi:hypothetical protein